MASPIRKIYNPLVPGICAKMIIQSRERCREKTGGTQSRAGAALKNRIGFFRRLCYNTVRKAGMGRLLRLSPSGRPETLGII